MWKYNLMGGGIVQIAIYGTQDIFLTGTPQITFFKIVYRRHTNFAKEFSQQHFIGVSDFGQDMACVVDKAGDLMNRVYLQIELPKVDLIKAQTYWTHSQQTSKQEYDRIQEYHCMVSNYVAINVDIAKKLEILIKTNNIPMVDIEATMANTGFIEKLVLARRTLQDYIANSNNFNDISELSGNKFNLIQQINQFDVQLLFNNAIRAINFGDPIDIQKRKAINNFLHRFLYQEMKNFYMQSYSIYNKKQAIYQSFLDSSHSERYKFAWVEEIGHAMIEHMEIKIGSNTIDKQTGDWLIIFNKIFSQHSQMENYNKMIGNVRELTIFDDNVKNTYKLFIPLQFWFCRHTGLSIPLIALRYHDVVINFRLKDLSKLCYVGDEPGLLDIANIQSQYNINIVDAKLYVEYIFLDTDERRRFAQSTHEYLIETVQYNELSGVAGKQYNSHLEFSHPTKFVIWFAQPNFYRDNPDGRNKCQWNNFGTNPDGTGYSMNSTHLRLNSYDRTDPHLDIKYFNYLQPYYYFNSSPTDGINVYSFATKPTLHQPSSTINLGRIDDFGIVSNFSNEFIKLSNSDVVAGVPPGFYMGVYIMSYNIFRIFGGMGGLAFQNSK